MRVRLLPSAFTEDSVPTLDLPQYLTSFLINDTVCIDAGSIGFWCDADAQSLVRDVFITHTHIDHIASLPLFLESALRTDIGGVNIYGNAAVLECLQQDLFNGRVWPDFIHISKTECEFMKLHELEEGKTVEIGELRVTPIGVSHAVPTFGFLVDDGSCTVAFPSDTGPTEEFWRQARGRENLAGVFLEASFSDSMERLAAITGHLTPKTFAGELHKLDRDVPTYAVHIKAAQRSRVLIELADLQRDNVRIAASTTTYEF